MPEWPDDLLYPGRRKGNCLEQTSGRGKILPRLNSYPGENAITKMAAALHALAGYEPEIRLIPEVEYLLRELLRVTCREHNISKDNLDNLLDGSGEKPGGNFASYDTDDCFSQCYPGRKQNQHRS